MLNQQSVKHVGNLHGDLRAVAMRAVDIFKRENPDTLVFQVDNPYGGVRTQAQQDELVRKGVSKTRNSRHLHGKAVDLVPIVNGVHAWTMENKKKGSAAPYFHKIARAMKKAAVELSVPIEWGFEEWGWDMPHYQLPKAQYPDSSDVSLIGAFDPAKFDAIMNVILHGRGDWGGEGQWNEDDPSMRGITLAVAEQFYDKPVSKPQLKQLTEAEAKKIYRALFYDKIKGEKLPDGVNLAVMDFAVHSGVHAAIMKLQEAVGAEPDAIFGPATMAAVQAAKPEVLIKDLMELRWKRMEGRPNFVKNKNGWRVRVDAVAKEALVVAMRKDPEPVPAPGATPVPISIKEALANATERQLRDELLRRGYSEIVLHDRRNAGATEAHSP